MKKILDFYIRKFHLSPSKVSLLAGDSSSKKRLSVLERIFLKRNKSMKIEIVLLLITILPLVSSAHWIVGYVQDAADATSPNGRTIRLLDMNTTQEMLGIVGPTGQSGTSNVYMMDCELLQTPCVIGDVLSLNLTSDGSGYNSDTVNVTVTSAGFDIAPNITMTTPLELQNVTVDDIFTSPENEIDLITNSTAKVFCTGVIETYTDINSIDNVTSILYASSSTLQASDDNNNHYSNNTCNINKTYGTASQGFFNCSFDVEYYANSEGWTCQATVTNNLSVSSSGSDATSINPLLSIWVNDTVNFSTVDVTTVSDERTLQVINLGNVKINLSIYGYGQTPGDGNSMVCTRQNLTIGDTKYNLSQSNSGPISLNQADSLYTNLSSFATTEPYGLNFRQNDISNEAFNNTYWRVYVEKQSLDNCQGNIIIGATLS